VLFVAVSNHFSLLVLVAAPTVLAAPALQVAQSTCSSESCVTRVADREDSLLSLPKGMDQCHSSGPATACSLAGSPADYIPGTPAAPAGQVACAADAGKALPPTPAACGDAILASLAPARTGAQAGAVPGQNLPAGSLGTPLPSRLELTSSADTVATNHLVVLTATASSTVTGTNLAIEIFDTTSNTLVGACAQGSQCSVAYSALSGTHEFAAYATHPSSSADLAEALSSNKVSVGWLESAIAASASVAGQGQSVTLVASSSVDVQRSGRWLEIYDLTTDSRITYCAMGTVCTTSLKQMVGGVHEIVGYVNGSPEAVSAPIYITWLDVSLSATSIGPKSGGTIYLKATTNADLANTPWVVGIYDEQGHLVDHACKTGTTCNVKAWMSGGTTPRYTAVVGALPSSKTTITSPAVHPAPPAAPSLVDVQAKSSAIEPTHLLWGVDSCKAFVGDVTGNLYSKVAHRLGTPDFWGRYLTNTVCPGISRAEVALAAGHHMGILPIYNDYNCSAVVYYGSGRAYAAQAVAAAKRLGIPQGTVLAIDIEPPGAACPGAGGVNAGFVSGWYDGVHGAGYIPVYYGNGTRASEFARAWCTAVAAQPTIATGSDLWSFQPSLLGNFNKHRAPNYGPFDTGCAGNMLAWQYALSGGNAVDVDQDEAISSLPLWYP
jgi:glycoside hydrolase-like protein